MERPNRHGLTKDPVNATLEALNRRLEGIRQEHLARNRSNLREFNPEQLKQVECLTAAITAKIFREVALEIEHSAAAGDGRRVSETISLMLGLAFPAAHNSDKPLLEGRGK